MKSQKTWLYCNKLYVLNSSYHKSLFYVKKTQTSFILLFFNKNELITDKSYCKFFQ